jgi:septal ring factor EnvC (AmiA/AmiB activator)
MDESASGMFVLASDYDFERDLRLFAEGERTMAYAEMEALRAQLVESRERIDLIASQANRLNDEKNAAESQLADIKERAGKLAKQLRLEAKSASQSGWGIGYEHAAERIEKLVAASRTSEEPK